MPLRFWECRDAHITVTAEKIGERNEPSGSLGNGEGKGWRVYRSASFTRRIFLPFLSVFCHFFSHSGAWSQVEGFGAYAFLKKLYMHVVFVYSWCIKGKASSKISRRASIWKVVSDCLFIFFKFLYFGLWNCSSRSGTVNSFLTALVKIGLYGPMIKKFVKNCVTSDRHQVWHTGSRQLKPITWLVSVPNRWYASRNDVLKTHKNGRRRGKEFVTALAIKKLNTFGDEFQPNMSLTMNLKAFESQTPRFDLHVVPEVVLKSFSTPWGTPLYKLYRYVPPHRVGFCAVLV